MVRTHALINFCVIKTELDSVLIVEKIRNYQIHIGIERLGLIQNLRTIIF